MSGHGNDILATLPAAERTALGVRLERRRTEVRDELYRPMQRLEYVYFPVTCVVTLLTTLEDGRGIETATIGREGAVGIFLLLGDDRDLNVAVQMAGELLRLPADVFRAAASGDTKLGR